VSPDPTTRRPADTATQAEAQPGAAEIKGAWNHFTHRNRNNKMEELLTFSEALEKIKAGEKLARTGWNDKGQFVFLVPASVFTVNRAPLLGIYPDGTRISYRAHIDIADGHGGVSTWAPSNGDALADDWQVVA
jgi:hypothetical protein